MPAMDIASRAGRLLAVGPREISLRHRRLGERDLFGSVDRGSLVSHDPGVRLGRRAAYLAPPNGGSGVLLTCSRASAVASKVADQGAENYKVTLRGVIAYGAL
jgi:hypothetical protein